MAHVGNIDIDKLNSALDETEKRKQHETEMEKQLDEVIPRRFLIDMFGNLPLYHVRFGRLVSGANPDIGESLIKLSDLGNAIVNLPYKHDTQVIQCQAIQCKDCKHFDKDEFCYIWEVYRTNESYCDLGERKEE